MIRSERDTGLSADTLAVGGNVWLRVTGVDTAAAVIWSINDTTIAGVVERHSARLHTNGRKVGNATVTASLDSRTGTFGLVIQQHSSTNHAPLARLEGPTSGVEGTALSFSAKSSSDPDHDELRYAWSFGDGSAKDTGATVTHTYTDNASRTVTVIVADPAGLADSASLSVAIANAPPVISALEAPSAPIDLSDSVRVMATVSDPGAGDVLTITFDWGDGKTSSGTDRHGAHLYAAAGTYAVKATVRDDDGDSASRSASVAVAKSSNVNGYEVIDLGTLGGTSSRPYGLNDNDVVVGSSATLSGEVHAFVWRDGAISDLATDLYQSRAEMITNGGLIAGVGGAADAGVHVLQWDSGVTRDLGNVGPGSNQFGNLAVTGLRTTVLLAWGRSEMERYTSAIWQNGAKTQISGLPGALIGNTEAQATALNDSRQVVGASLIYGGLADIYHAFLWENGTSRDLGVLQEFTCDRNGGYAYCGNSRAMDINDQGVVVGTSNDSKFDQHAVFWADGVIHDLGPGVPLTINDAGDIAGNSLFNYATNSGEAGHGYFWRNGARTDIGSLGGATFVTGMNGQSTLTGTSFAADGRPHAFVWKPGQSRPTDLGTGPSDMPGVGAFAVAINERGDVVGYTCDNFQPGNGFCNNARIRAILWRRKS